MFGKRFSISASTLAVAGACSVMFTAPVVWGQGYQQTSFPRYARPQLSRLSAGATNPPSFSDTAADSSAMSPNSWGESAISNPYAGYANNSSSSVFSNATPNASSVFVQQQVPQQIIPQQIMPQQKIAQQIIPPSNNVSVLDVAGTSNSSQATAGPANDSLTNTDYARKTQRPDRYADASFGIDSSFATNRDAELTELPKIPQVEIPAPKTQPEGLGQIPFNAPTQSKPTAKDSAEVISGGDTFEPATSFEGKLTPVSTRSNLSSVGSNVILPQHVPAQPVVTQHGYPLYSPAPTQPTYFQTAPQPQYAPVQSTGPISNDWRVGAINTGQFQNQSFLGASGQPYNSGFGIPTLSSNVGHRTGSPTTRNQSIFDDGELFDNEDKKKEFPPFREIIATGKFYGNAELGYFRPHFLGNTAISIDGAAFSESIPFDFDNEPTPHFRFGFESKYGPGFELNYFSINANSENISQTFGGDPISTIASITGPNRFTQFTADAAGETLNANHSFELETIGFRVFKDIAFKVSRIGGQFGFTYANIAQSLEATVNDGGGAILDSLENTTDFRGFGPKFGINYYRPVGHTPFEFVTSFSGAGLFGRRDQFVSNSQGLVERRFGADEFITVLDIAAGLQFKKTVGEGRAWFAKLAFVHQSWLGGGTAVDPQGDFGLKGVTFGVGYNR